jgi:crotonobetainyl-CoA:carnitine CoA-transferase CaiB-like acyl-CoA transferase
VFPAKDGSIVIACLMNSFWERICRALGMDDWSGDARFDSLEKRRDARATVNARIEGITSQRKVEELVAVFTKYEVPHAPILGISEALSQPQAKAREMVVEVEHSSLGTIPIVNRPIKFPNSPQPKPAAPPMLGENTDEILSQMLGLSEAQIAELRMTGVVA